MNKCRYTEEAGAKISHTPGPWENDYCIEVTAGSRIICSMRYEYSDGENQANARLIAAAPEMYKLLLSLCDSANNTRRHEIAALLARIEGKGNK